MWVTAKNIPFAHSFHLRVLRKIIVAIQHLTAACVVYWILDALDLDSRPIEPLLSQVNIVAKVTDVLDISFALVELGEDALEALPSRLDHFKVNMVLQTTYVHKDCLNLD